MEVLKSTEQKSTWSTVSERAGSINSVALVRELMQPPSAPLLPEDREAVKKFEKGLLNTDVGNDTATFGQLIAECVSKANLNQVLVFPHYFKSGEVLFDGIGQLCGVNEVTKAFSEASSAALDGSSEYADERLGQLRIIAKQSYDLAVADVARSILDDSYDPDPNALESISLTLDPDQLLYQAEALMQARSRLREIARNTKSSEEQPQARMAIIRVYSRRINGLMAGHYSRLDGLRQQALATDDHELLERVDSIGSAAVTKRLGEDATNTAVRLDRLKNGAAKATNGDGKQFSGVDPILTDALSQLHDEQLMTEQELDAESRFTLEDREAFELYMLEPEQIQDVIRRVLDSAGLNDWAVEVNPQKSSLSVDGVGKTYYVGDKSRSLYDVIVVAGVHELEHVSQALRDRALSASIAIADVGGRGVSPMREVGAKIKESKAALELFGVQYSGPALTYASALLEHEKGANITEMAAAFYKAKLKSNTEAKEGAAAEAADRAFRLVRSSGYDSTSMSYDERFVLEQRLSDMGSDAVERAIAVTSLNIEDQAELHRFGLLPDFSSSLNDDWTEKILEVCSDHIADALLKS